MYVVTYYDGENVLYTQEYSYGSVIDRPTSPSKEGYLFTGWFKDPELTQMSDFIDRCRGDMSLYAKWREDDRSDYIYLDGTDGDDANDGADRGERRQDLRACKVAAQQRARTPSS